MRCERLETIRKIAELAKIRLSQEEEAKMCEDIERIASYLSTLSEAAREIGGEPLYYVWDSYAHVREGGEPTPLEVKELPTARKDGFIVVPWRGGSVEDEGSMGGSERH